ncbi:Ycf48-like protein [compost metagenome]
MRRLTSSTLLAALLLTQCSVRAADNPFRDPLDTPAVTLQGALAPNQQPFLAVTLAGQRLVAVGLRGLIVLSDDGGNTWQQAQVPVQSDLTAVQFLTPEQGWAVGHEGVILHSGDGGLHWSKQFDGRAAAQAFVGYYQQRIDAGDATLAPYLQQVELNVLAGPVLPFLSVYFDDAQNGYAVGSFGTLVRTVDGGKSWQPWLEHIDNPDFLNLNAIRKIGSELYIAGERGSVFRLDRQQGRFVAVPTDYSGSFFGIVGNQHYILAFGLSGNAYRSSNGGQTWQAVNTGVQSSLTAGTLADDGSLLLTTANGLLLRSTDDSRTFTILRTDTQMPFADIGKASVGHYALVGYQGVALQALPPTLNRATTE